VKTAWLESLWGPRGARLLAGDVAVIFIFTALSIALLAGTGIARRSAWAVGIEVSGNEVLSLSRADDGVRQVEGPLGLTEIEIRNGQVRVLSSSCPLKLCQRAGWIGAAGEMIVCLPNEVVVRLSGRPPRGIDALSR
jgi:hypothetical protein